MGTTSSPTPPHNSAKPSSLSGIVYALDNQPLSSGGCLTFPTEWEIEFTALKALADSLFGLLGLVVEQWLCSF
jgi:hypothetical protein